MFHKLLEIPRLRRAAPDTLDLLAEHVRGHFASHRRAPISPEITPDEIRDHLTRTFDLTRPMDAERVFRETTHMLWTWAEHATNPRHFGLTRPTVDLPSVVADALAALYDPNLVIWEMSPAAVEIERYVLDFLGRFMGMDVASGFGGFTSGGQEANATAVAVALTRHFPAVGRGGLRALDGQPTFYLSREGHHSFDKIAHTAGLGREALRWIPVDSGGRMDVEALRAAIEHDRACGGLPFLIVATAGTINGGVVDPLEELSGLARECGLWLHVDGAWGAAAAISPSLRPHLAGLERADSLTFDGHKWLSVPVGAGMFFSKHRDAVAETFRTHAPYVPPMAGGDRDYPFVTSFQWSRRFIGLKIFMMLAERGIGEIVRRIDHQARLGDLLRRELSARGWSIVNRTALPVICFIHPAIDGERLTFAGIVDRLRREQSAWISRVEFSDGSEALRASITNYNSTELDVRSLVDRVTEAIA